MAIPADVLHILVYVVLVVFAVVAGGLSNVTSGGAGVLTIFVLVSYAGLTIQGAIATVLASSTITILTGAVMFQRSRDVNGWLSLTTGLSGILGAFLAARLALGTPPQVLEGAFGFFMIFLGGYTLLDYLRARRKTSSSVVTANSSPQSWLSGRDPIAVLSQVAFGAVIGVATGLFGVGGGSLTIAVFLFVFKLPTRQVLGTSLMASLFRYAGATAGYLASSTISPLFFGILTAGGVAGSIVGAKVIIGRQGSEGYVKLILIALFFFTAYEFLAKSL